MNRLVGLLALIALVTVGTSGPATAAPQAPSLARVTGAVSGAGPDGQAFRIPGVNVRLTPESDPTAAIELVSDDRGEFAFTDLQPGTYQLRAQLDGFGAFEVVVVAGPGSAVSRDVRLELASVNESVIVTASGNGDLQARETAPPVEIAQQTMQQVPIASEQFQSALPLVPGVVRGPDGLINMKGARENQSGLRVNNASVADPVTGEFTFRLPIEAVRSIAVVTSAYAAEYGQTSGGMTKIETAAGTDRWKVQVQNFQPRLRRRDGAIRGIESWTPRLAIGGPLVPQTLTLFQSLEYQFTRTRVEGQPALQGDTGLEGVNAFTQIDWTVSPNSHVSTGLAMFPQNRTYLGLNSFNPQGVTPNLDQRGYLLTTAVRRVLGPRSVLESHVGVRQLDTDVVASTPGPMMVLAPGENAGSYFNTQNRTSRRYEGLSAVSASRGAHLVKIGAGVSHDAYDGRTESRPVDVLRANGSRAESISFDGPAILSRGKTDLFAFVQDSWSATSRITADIGLRYDYDTVADAHHLAPRFGFSLAPGADRRTVVRGGVGVFYDKITLNAATFDQLPAQIVTRFTPTGQPIGSPHVERPMVEGGRVRNPEGVAWNLEVDRELTERVLVRVGYQQRAARREIIVDPRTGPTGTDLVLANDGHSRYREVVVTGRYHQGGHQVFVSYVRSTATGDLNDVNQFFANVENPIIRPNQYSRLPSDAPNRVVAWGEFGLPGGFGIAPLVEVRDGFPLSIVDENLDFVGVRNQAGHFPRFFALDVQAWKDVAIPWPRRLKARIGIKVFNLTNHFNPRDFDANQASAHFGEFSNGVSRTLRGKFVFDF